MQFILGVLLAFLSTLIYGTLLCVPNEAFLHRISTFSSGRILPITLANAYWNIESCDTPYVTHTWSGGKLIVSKNPTASSSGTAKLYEDHFLPPTTSPNRVFLYQVNGKESGVMKLSVVIKNTSPNATATLRIMRSGVAGPSRRHLVVGKKATERWFLSAGRSLVKSIPPGEAAQLDPTFHNHRVYPNNSLQGIWDYSITTDHSVTLCSLDEESDPVQDCLSAQVIRLSGNFQKGLSQQIRGTFPSTNKTLRFVGPFQNARIFQFPISDGHEDKFAVGVDQTDGSVQDNCGNFGVLYKIPIVVPELYSSVGYLTNPRRGKFSGAMKFGNEAVGLPVGANSVKRNTKGVSINKFSSLDKGKYFYLMYGGASNLPIRIFIVAC